MSWVIGFSVSDASTSSVQVLDLRLVMVIIRDEDVKDRDNFGLKLNIEFSQKLSIIWIPMN